jgi:hypothetical protein
MILYVMGNYVSQCMEVKKRLKAADAAPATPAAAAAARLKAYLQSYL